MIVLAAALGGLLLLMFSFAVARWKRKELLANEATRAARVPELGVRLSGAEHLWLRRSFDTEPSLVTLAGRNIKTSDDLHAALLSPAVSMSKRGPRQRAQKAAEVRARRTDLLELLPTLHEASVANAPVLDAVLEAAILTAPPPILASGLHALIDSQLPNIGVPGLDLPGLSGMHDALVDSASSASEHVLHSIADAHIPVLTIMSSIHRYGAAASNGLDVRTALTEGAMDIALRGGGMAAGATIGAHTVGAFFPVVGHVVGAGLGALGGWLGGEINKNRQQGPLRAADLALKNSLSAVGGKLPKDAWSTLAAESWEISSLTDEALHVLESEFAAMRTLRQRLWPSFLLVATEQAVLNARADAEDELLSAREFDDLVRELERDECGQSHLAALALVRPELQREFGLSTAEIDVLNCRREALAEERAKLVLLRGGS